MTASAGNLNGAGLPCRRLGAGPGATAVLVPMPAPGHASWPGPGIFSRRGRWCGISAVAASAGVVPPRR